MKISQTILMLSLLSSSLVADSKFCIQVTQADDFNKNNIKPAVARILKKFDKARIDMRSGRLVLRVGNYNRYAHALKDLKDIQESYFDAYIRRCDYIRSKVIYPKSSKRDIQPRKLQSQIKKVQRQTSPTPKPKSKRRLVVINGRVQIVDDSKPVGSQPYKRQSFQEKKIAPKAKESFIYNKQNRYNSDLHQDCNRCYATSSSQPKKNTTHTDATHQERRDLLYPQKEIAKKSEKKEKSWLPEIFQKEVVVEKKNRINYTYIDDQLPSDKTQKKDIYYNQKIETDDIIEIEAEEEVEVENYSDLEYMTKEENQFMQEDIFSDTSFNEERYEKPKPKPRKKKEKIEDEEDYNIDINIDVDIDENEYKFDEEVYTEIDTEKENRSDKGFFDFLKKPVQKEVVYKEQEPTLEIVPEKKVQKYSFMDEYESNDFIAEPKKRVTPDLKQEKIEKKDKEDYNIDINIDVDEDEYKFDEEVYTEKESEPAKGFFDFLKKPVKKEVVPYSDTKEFTQEKAPIKKVQNYNLMDEYDDNEYTKREKPKSTPKQTNNNNLNKIDKYQLMDSYKDEYEKPSQAYFSKEVQHQIETEKEPQDLYKNQYMFNNQEPKKENRKTKQEEMIVEDDSYKNQYMYQNQNSNDQDIGRENQYFNYENESEEQFKNQYMYENSDNSSQN
ncbi:MAG: hypothetical protein U9P38_05330, partial [Campylobacterota bacterium]|nr:hypothetical protein [Campylobacterota bacterium]